MNKKILICCAGLLMSLNIAVAASSDPSIQIQMLDSEIAQLTKEKQQKYSELEKCEKSTNGFKIAGITTLGLTAVGVGVNVYQMSQRNKREDQLSSNSENLKKLRAEKAAADEAKAEQDCKNQIIDQNMQECIKGEDGKWTIRTKQGIKDQTLTDDQKTEYNKWTALAKTTIGSDACAKDKLPECANLQKVLSMAEQNIALNIWDEKSVDDLKIQINTVANAFEKKHNLTQSKLTNEEQKNFDTYYNQAKELYNSNFCQKDFGQSNANDALKKAIHESCISFADAFLDDSVDYNKPGITPDAARAGYEKLKTALADVSKAKAEFDKTANNEQSQQKQNGKHYLAECNENNLSDLKKALCDFVKDEQGFMDAKIVCAGNSCGLTTDKKRAICSGRDDGGASCLIEGLVSKEVAEKTFKFDEYYDFMSNKFMRTGFRPAFNKKLFEQICAGSTGRLDFVNISVYCADGLREGISGADSRKFYYTADCAGDCAYEGRVFSYFDEEEFKKDGSGCYCK